MNAVVLTVKYSYVASTKYTRQGVVTVSALWSTITIYLNVTFAKNHIKYKIVQMFNIDFAQTLYIHFYTDQSYRSIVRTMNF